MLPVVMDFKYCNIRQDMKHFPQCNASYGIILYRMQEVMWGNSDETCLKMQDWDEFFSLKEYLGISGRLKCPISLTSIDRHSLKKLIFKFPTLLWLHVFKIYKITWIILLHWILYCNVDARASEIQNMQRSAYFVTTVLFLQKSYWSKVL